MKKTSYILTLLLTVSLSLFAEHVDPETARKVATTFLNNNDAKSNQLVDLSKTAGFHNLYIFSTEESFVIMSADDCVKPILGYSLTGKFETEGLPENIKWWLQGYNEQIADAVKSGIKATKETRDEWDALLLGKPYSKETSVDIVSPLISTIWDQVYPYNYYCPDASEGSGGHVLTGCVATAMAQVMRYWEYPTMGSGSNTYTHSTYGSQTANFGATTYEWDHMPNSLLDNPNQTEIEAVATLMYHCGVAVDMNYGTGSSGTWSGYVPSALISFFNYSPSATYVSRDGFEDSEWITFLKGELDEARPIFYSGSNAKSGHAFICDGYRSDNYFHFNWGWSGYDGSYGSTHGNNGYWAIGSLSPNAGGSGNEAGTYNQSNAVIAWVEPIFSLTSPTLSASITEHVVTLTWNTIAEAVSYDVYRGNTKIATNITDLSYIDEDVSFGHYYEYYVRAVSAETKSNPSNSVTVVDTYQGRVPQSLDASIAVSDNSVNLTWAEPQSQSMDLHYGTGNLNSSFGSEEEESNYWGQCYPSEALGDFAGMAIDHVSIYLGYEGSYSVFLYKDNVTSESNLLASKTFSASSRNWYDIEFNEAIPLDITHDLWIVFYTSKSVKYPAYFDYYYGENKEHAHYIWKNFSENITSVWNTENISWPIKIHLTDGVFAYNVYRDNTLVSEQQASNTYQDLNLSDGNHEYFIKTYANNWESEASSVVSIDYSTEHRISEAVSISDNLMLSDHNKFTIESTGILTVDGEITNSNAANLIIEDGGQLITNNTVNATVIKDINAATNWGTETSYTPDGWYFIASPVDGYSISHIITGTTSTDLYSYDELSNSWWNAQNTTTGNHAFNTLTRNQGYLYANNTGQDLEFAGEMQATNTSNIEKPLSYKGSGSTKGFNLLGNPFTCNLDYEDIYIGDTAITVYYSVEGGSEIIAKRIKDHPIKPGRGFMVQAKAEGQSIVFHPTSKGNETVTEPSFIQIEAGNNDFMDCAYVQIGEGNTLRKMSISNHVPHVYAMQDGNDYSAITIEVPQGELPVCFKPTQNGTYNLNIKTNNLDLDYLHLIDNMTGADIDLLQNQSYTFEAKAGDFESRFRLLFNAIENTNSNTTDITDGVTQILDVTGRFVGTNVNENMKPGVYILRTVNGNEIKTEKIIIK